MLFKGPGSYRHSSRYYSRSRKWRFLPLIPLLLILWDLCTILLPPPIHRVKIDSSSSSSTTNLIHPPTNPHSQEKIFLASLQYNSESFLRTHFNAAILNLAHHFGPQNIYICILERGSADNTRAALLELDIELERLGVGRTFIFDDREEGGEGEEGWVWTGRGRRERRRVPVLAGLRNRVLGVLRGVREGEGGRGRSFDRLVWVEEVVFTTEDVLTLLSTHNGHYSAACSLDFSSPPSYHDTLSLRDSNFNPTITPTWPYFSSPQSRHALFSNSPIPVQSCWNGLISFSTTPFYTSPSLSFRAIPDSLAQSHLEASETCLIHVDNAMGRELGGVWVNPNVRVAYTGAVYDAVNPEGGWAEWPFGRGWERLGAVWWNRWVGVAGWVDRVGVRLGVGRMVREWEVEMRGKGEEEVREEGVGCLVNEMQVLIENGWAQV